MGTELVLTAQENVPWSWERLVSLDFCWPHLRPLPSPLWPDCLMSRADILPSPFPYTTLFHRYQKATVPSPIRKHYGHQGGTSSSERFGHFSSKGAAWERETSPQHRRLQPARVACRALSPRFRGKDQQVLFQGVRRVIENWLADVSPPGGCPAHQWSR